MTLGDLLAYPSGDELLTTELLVLSDSLFTVEISLKLVSNPNLSEQINQIWFSRRLLLDPQVLLEL